jgi:hypothetical protein
VSIDPTAQALTIKIDRVAPTRRPEGRAVGHQRWRALLFLHWPVPVEVLRPLVPPRLQLDTFDGVAYVGLVPFAMRRVRPWWAPERVAFDFLETNVRTYVHVDGQDPGVYFFSLDASSRVAVAVARRQFGLPYHFARMRLARDGNALTYASRRLAGVRPRSLVRAVPGEHLGPSAPGTLEHFLLERYILHVEGHGGLMLGRVHHTPYPVQGAGVLEIGDELVAAAGLPRPATPPPIIHFSAGVDVEIFALRPE